jgi:hypothetical protein
MGNKWILHNLGEALEALQGMIGERKGDQECEFSRYQDEMRHLYNHLNTAWNSRDVDEKEIRDCLEEDFSRWRQFPGDIRM